MENGKENESKQTETKNPHSGDTSETEISVAGKQPLHDNSRTSPEHPAEGRDGKEKEDNGETRDLDETNQDQDEERETLRETGAEISKSEAVNSGLQSQTELAKENNGMDDRVESESSTNLNRSGDTLVTIKSMTPSKAKKRGIFVSYSSEASFEERRLIAYTVKELKNIGFADDIWFDKDDGELGSPFCYQQRLEIIEKCRAVLIFFSKSYFSCRLCKHEGKVLLSRNEERMESDGGGSAKPVKLFCVNYDCASLPIEYRLLEEDIINLNSEILACSSIAEKSSAIVGAFSEEMEKFAPLFGRIPPSPPNEPEGSFQKRRIFVWDVDHVQEWLNSMKIHPRFCLSFEENQIDGYLLLSLNDSDLESHLMVDSRVVRRKLQQQLNGILDKENQVKDHWYMKFRKIKAKDNSVYIIYDPTDAKFAGHLMADLVKKKLQVFKHDRLGQSKHEFLQLNGSHLAASSHVIILMSAASAASLFVYSELMFADWLGKAFIVAMVKNSWDSMRPNIQAVLGTCPAVDFEAMSYSDSLDVLLYHLKPFRNMPAVILEQEFLDRMVNGLKPLRVLASTAGESRRETIDSPLRPKIFLSYHWDIQTKVQNLAQYLESQGFECWTDVSTVAKQPTSRGSPVGTNHDTLQSQIQRNMKASNAVICCVTQKYICSDNCSKDLNLAESLSKPVVPLMFQWMVWPPEGGAIKVRKILAPLHCIDLSNEKLFKKNLSAVMFHLKKFQGALSSREGGFTHVR